MNKKKLGFVVLILHIVGAIGTSLESTRVLFLALTPFNLLISFLVILISHGIKDQKIYRFFIFTFIVGLGIEILGVQTGFPFGDYSYGNTLGPKILGAPYLIGINWFLLSYVFGQFSSKLIGANMTAAFLAASFMTAMDYLIEPVAISLDYWEWDQGIIPVSNFLAWWVISFIIQIVFQRSHFGQYNPVAHYLIISQLIYFSFVLLLL